LGLEVAILLVAALGFFRATTFLGLVAFLVMAFLCNMIALRKFHVIICKNVKRMYPDISPFGFYLLKYLVFGVVHA
jgi:hypothetical protein